MIKVISVGKVKDKALQTLCNEYVKRMQPYQKLDLVEVKDESIPQNVSIKQAQQIKDKEGNAVLAKVKETDYVILLDLHGQSCSSEEFAKKLADIQTYQSANIIFIIGGSLGVSDALVARANYRLQLSKMTFLHQMSKYILLEQIYRAYKIMNRETYHK